MAGAPNAGAAAGGGAGLASAGSAAAGGSAAGSSSGGSNAAGNNAAGNSGGPGSAAGAGSGGAAGQGASSGAGGTAGAGSGSGGSAGGQSHAGAGGAAGAGTGGGGGAGGGGYNPCPTDGNPCIILPFGDSITDGVGSTDLAGYRSALFKLIVQANQKVTFVGSRSSGPDQVLGKKFPPNHEGHPGWTIDSGYVSFGDGISTLIPMPAFKTMPHIVLLMIGTNDVSATMGTDMIATRLDTLLGKIVQTAPNALVVTAQLTPIGWKPAAATNYNAKIPGIVQARVAKGQHLAVVDMSKMSTANLNSDSLHPTDAGYAFMANVWYTAIQSYLPK